MSVRIFAAVFLLLATSPLSSIAKKSKKSGVSSEAPPLPPGGSGWPPFPPGGSGWPPFPPGGWPPFPPGGWPPFPPGGWPPFPSGGWPPLPPGIWPRPGGGPMPPFSSGGGCSCSCTCPPPRAPKVFMVGDEKQWSFGTNYTRWVLDNAPFYLGDILEFKYPPPVQGRPFNHSVYVLQDLESFEACNLTGSLRIGDVFAGGGSDGFKWTLEPKFPNRDPVHYIACGEKQGFHCKVGTMKFAVLPLLRGFP